MKRRALLAACAAPALARAELTRRPITIIVPSAAGGPVDLLARMLAQGFQGLGAGSAVVENRTGGAGNIAIDLVRRAPADGATMLLIPAGNLTINPTLLRNLNLDIERDFAPVSVLATTPNVVLAGPALAARDIAGLVAAARAAPGRISYGSSGVGGQLHLLMELFRAQAGIDIQHVPYRGTTPALSDLLAGRIELLSSNLPVALPVVRDGRARALAITTPARSPFLPDVPTMQEAGFAGFDVTSWYGLVVPRATPAPVVEAITAASERVLRASENAPALAAQGLDILCEPPAVFTARLRRETTLWAQVIRERGITAE